jgi:predicted TIM-barrel fold metal-dependent hydrolase
VICHPERSRGTATIDADAHVIESERTWDFLRPGDERFRPVRMSGDGQLGEYWRIGYRAFPRRLNAVEETRTSVETQELLEIESRLAHMDALGVGMQVIYPTTFLTPVTTDHAVEAALYQAYNRWMADAWQKSGRRLGWAALAPTLSMELAVRELTWAKDHGACALFVRGTEGGKVLSDPYFHPLYERAGELDLPLCLHSGNGCSALDDLYRANSAIFSRAKLSAIGAIHEIVLSGLPQRFPRLRFGVLETSASWVPFFCHDLAARLQKSGAKIDRREILAANRVYVACQTNDDLPYVIQYAGEDNLVIGSDYGHADTSTELEALRKLQGSGVLPAHAVGKILHDNPRALYGLRA